MRIKIKFISLFIISLIAVISTDGLIAQNDNYFAVYFIDKGNTKYNASEILSSRALGNRIRNEVIIDDSDFPVAVEYISAVAAETGCEPVMSSKWLNCTVFSGKGIDIEAIRKHDFVKKVESFSYNRNNDKIISRQEINPVDVTIEVSNHPEKGRAFDYGASGAQYRLLNGTKLHDMGYTGTGVLIAVLDDGFFRVNELAGFQHLYFGNNIYETINFINDDNLFSVGTHGMTVFSLLGAYISGVMIGTAPTASFLLYKTEDADSESLLEEYAWVTAAERADSCGVDIITSSLVYTTMDDPAESHKYTDMDGATCVVTLGAEAAASKGILVINSAGNHGLDEWHYIGAPADGTNVVAVGGVHADSTTWLDSSRGPTADGRIKPDICAQSCAVVLLDPISGSGTFTMSGTSFCAPVIAGFAACLMQAHPHASTAEIKSSIYYSANKCSNPDNDYGRGIPNFYRAYNVCGLEDFSEDESATAAIKVFPNPAGQKLFIQSEDDDIVRVRIMNISGGILTDYYFNNEINVTVDINGLKCGTYLVSVVDKTGHMFTKKIIKSR